MLCQARETGHGPPRYTGTRQFLDCGEMKFMAFCISTAIRRAGQNGVRERHLGRALQQRCVFKCLAGAFCDTSVDTGSVVESPEFMPALRPPANGVRAVGGGPGALEHHVQGGYGVLGL